MTLSSVGKYDSLRELAGVASATAPLRAATV
jgi:hypothetical protein